MIGEKLLSEIMGLDSLNYPHDIGIKGTTLFYKTKGQILDKHINIYELTHKMKRWICDMEQEQAICSHKSYCCSYAIGEWYSGYLFIKTTYDDKVREEIKGKGDTEFKAVVDHCEWILKETA